MIKYVNTTINGLTLRGTAHVPEDVTGPVPTVLLFHGFGAVRDEYFCSFVQISRQLAQRGIAAIAFDFSGHGESDGDFIDFTFSNEVYEGTQLVAFVKTVDIYPTAKQYLGPVKIIHGADDTIAPVSYAQKYVDTYQQPVDLTVVPGADHSWGDVPTRESLFNATLAFFDKLYK